MRGIPAACTMGALLVCSIACIGGGGDDDDDDDDDDVEESGGGPVDDTAEDPSDPCWWADGYWSFTIAEPREGLGDCIYHDVFVTHEARLLCVDANEFSLQFVFEYGVDCSFADQTIDCSDPVYVNSYESYTAWFTGQFSEDGRSLEGTYYMAHPDCDSSPTTANGEFYGEAQ